MSTYVMVAELPKCDFCKEEGKDTDASVDGKTVYGPWANMCDNHYLQNGVGLGLGYGQFLILKKKE